jgi:hypothetical protein
MEWGRVAEAYEEIWEGLNPVEHARAEMGVAAKAVGIEFSVRSVGSGRPNRLNNRSIATTDGECPFGLNAIHVNADQTPVILEKLPHSLKSEHFNVGYWARELERFPERREKSLGRSSRLDLQSFVPS